ncbi:unnamed protein product [Brachionus calyciflorus]|uniref:FLYWCH-type domain-containing protein n=1 Tax=Brachionus calyciflorus TaxID=104777 RepID=A0A813U0H7_9BILA|nr:unnamed protein product [Brachionus calyciflorus]
MTDNTKIIHSSHEGPMLLHGEFIYLKNQERPNGNIYWRCKEYSTLKCPASITTKGLSTDIINLSKQEHFSEHPKTSNLDVGVLSMLNNCRKRAITETIPIRQIYRSELAGLVSKTKDIEKVAKNIPKFENVKKNLYKVRLEDLPKIPKERSDIELSLDRFCLHQKFS